MMSHRQLHPYEQALVDKVSIVIKGYVEIKVSIIWFSIQDIEINLIQKRVNVIT